MVNFENGKIPANDVNLNKMQTDLQEEIRGTVIYENTDGTTEGITLNDSISNYKYLKIYYMTGDAQHIQEIYMINGTAHATLHSIVLADETNLIVQIQWSDIAITNNALSVVSSGYANISQDTSKLYVSKSLNYIKITKIIGYKEV